jgi:hypothetical protein
VGVVVSATVADEDAAEVPRATERAERMAKDETRLPWAVPARLVMLKLPVAPGVVWALLANQTLESFPPVLAEDARFAIAFPPMVGEATLALSSTAPV